MATGLWLILGAALAAGVIGFARRRGHQGEQSVFAVGLVVASLIYVMFAVSGAAGEWILIEAGGVALFGAVALLGRRVSPAYLVLGWTAHVGWDVALHLVTPRPFVGSWYPTLCTSFDLLVAAYIAWRAWERRKP